ncbi:aliphatic sulfonate ABC transporter substrate-binding protein [Bacillus salipaludis]|uniref:ABC transporter substrate-binding protein n=1 Tax=Bacillus salipaludis TaxID=2547811 RepID=UPI002E20E693|nr:aliphatic sulfonate ABC transporter substrate-binding protein [Bacillus salipaludis]
MQKYRRHVSGFVLTILFIFLLAGCSSSIGKTNAQNKNEPVEVNIALNGKMGPLAIAREKGWFEEEFKGLNAKVKWSEFTSGPPLLESLASNRVDLSFLGDGALIAGIDKNLPFEVIGQTGTGESNVRILVQKNGDIKNVNDLKGKTVGVPLGTTAQVYLIKALKANGLTINDVKLINLQPDDAQAAFQSKKLDAWAAWNPYYLNNVEKGNAIALDVNKKIFAPGAIIARNDFAKEHPDLVQAYLRVYKKAVDWQIANPNEASKIYSAQTKLPADLIYKIITAEKPSIFFTEESINAQQESINTLADAGYIKKPFMYKDQINNEFIDKAFKK